MLASHIPDYLLDSCPLQVGDPVKGSPDGPITVNKEGSTVTVTFGKENPDNPITSGPVLLKVCKGMKLSCTCPNTIYVSFMFDVFEK